MKKFTLLLSFLFMLGISYSQEIIWEEDFEAATMPAGWEQGNAGGTGVQEWTFGESNISGSPTVNFDNNAAIFNDAVAGDTGNHDNQWLKQSVGLDATTYSNLTLGYEYAIGQVSGDGVLRVSIYSSSNDAGWYIFQEYNDIDQEPTYVEYDLEPFLASHPTIDRDDIRVAFVYDDENSTWTYGAGIGSANMKGISLIPENDACTDAVNISIPLYENSVYTESVDATYSTNNDGFITVTDCGSMNDGVWYSFFSLYEGSVTIDVMPDDSWDPEIGVYTGSCGAFTCVDNADNGFSNGDPETLTFDTTANQMYYINIGQWSSSSNYPEGPFELEVSYDCGGTTPLNDLIANATLITDESYTETDVAFPCANYEASDFAGGCSDWGNVKTLFYKFKASEASTVTATLSNPSMPIPIVIFYEAESLDAIAENELTYISDASNPCNTGISSSIETLAGHYYYLVTANSVVSDLSIEGLIYVAPPENDTCENAIDITDGLVDGSYSVEQDATYATNNDGFIMTCGDTYGMDDGVWYSFQAIYDATISIEVVPDATWDPEIAVYTGSCDDLTCVGSVDDGVMLGTPETLTIDIINGEIYTINIGSYGGFTPDIPPTDGDEGPFTMNITTNCSEIPINSLIDDANLVTPLSYTDVAVNFPCAEIQDEDLGSPCSLEGIRTSFYKFESIDESTVTITFSENNEMSGAMFYEAPNLDASAADLVYIDIETNPCEPGLEHSIVTEEGKFYYIVAINGAQSDIYINGANHTTTISESVVDGFEMYPNPVNSILTLNATNSIDSVSFYNLIGQKVLHIIPNSTQIQIDMGTLPTGSYVVKVETEKQIGTYNLIKK